MWIRLGLCSRAGLSRVSVITALPPRLAHNHSGSLRSWRGSGDSGGIPPLPRATLCIYKTWHTEPQIRQSRKAHPPPPEPHFVYTKRGTRRNREDPHRPNPDLGTRFFPLRLSTSSSITATSAAARRHPRS